jgi:GT2 family glycosyltransferase
MVDVSVIIPYHQDRGYLFDAIESYEAQEFTGTSELILSHNPTFLLGQNFNAGIAQAQGKYVKILPDDDLLTPNCLQDLFEAAERTDADLIFAQAINIDERPEFKDKINNVHWKSSFIEISLDALIFENFIHGGTTFYRTSMLKELGGYDESLWTAEEYEFHLRCISKGYKLYYEPKIVFNYRVWSASKSIVYRRTKSIERVEYIESIRDRFR